MAAESAKRVGDRIRKAREAKDWTQRQLAREMTGKVDGPSISRWERGKAMPQPPNLDALAEALDVDVSYFLVPDPKPGTPDLMGTLNGDETPSPATQLAQLQETLDLLAAAVQKVAGDTARLERMFQEHLDTRPQQGQEEASG